MIPRRLHFIWIGDEPIPEARQRCIDSCIAAHPGYEVTVWTSVAQFGLLRNRRAFFDAQRLAPPTWPHAAHQIRSNILRFEIMARYGGVFFDTDVVCLRSLDPLLKQAEEQGKSGVLGWEIQDRWLGEAVIACVPEAPFMERIVDNLEAWAFKRRGKAATVTVGPQYITPLLQDHLDDVLVVPQVTFYPARYDQPKLSDALVNGRTKPDERTFAIHLWGNRRRRRGAPL